MTDGRREAALRMAAGLLDNIVAGKLTIHSESGRVDPDLGILADHSRELRGMIPESPDYPWVHRGGHLKARILEENVEETLIEYTPVRGSGTATVRLPRESFLSMYCLRPESES